MPKGVEFKDADGVLSVKGPKGTLNIAKPAGVSVSNENGAGPAGRRQSGRHGAWPAPSAPSSPT